MSNDEMFNSTGKTTLWDRMNTGQSEIVDSWNLMGNPFPIVAIVVSYLAFVLYIGPALMKDRRPFKLTGPLVFYNAAQVLMSFHIVTLCFPHLWNRGLVYMECLMNVGELRAQLLNGLWLYLFIKITELLDTVFFVLRKKSNQISFLHVYHHSMLVLTTWTYLKYTPTEHIVFIGFINSLVHVIMYTYYGLSALGPTVTPYVSVFKKYITSLQLIQFFMILVQIVTSYFVSNCPPHILWMYYFTFNALLFIYLFSDFYNKTYNDRKRTRDSQQKKAL